MNKKIIIILFNLFCIVPIFTILFSCKKTTNITKQEQPNLLIGKWSLEKPNTYVKVTHFYSDGTIKEGNIIEPHLFRIETIQFNTDYTGEVVLGLPLTSNITGEIVGSYNANSTFTYTFSKSTVNINYNSPITTVRQFTYEVGELSMFVKTDKIPIKTNVPGLVSVELTMRLIKR